MKSPVPVVMSYMGRSRPSGSTETTRRSASLLIAVPAMQRLRVIAGSVVWNNRSISCSPPSSRTYAMPLGRWVRSMTVRKPSDASEDTVQSMISASQLPMRSDSL